MHAAPTAAALALVLAAAAAFEGPIRGFRPSQSLDLLRMMAVKPWTGPGPYSRWDRPPRIEVDAGPKQLEVMNGGDDNGESGNFYEDLIRTGDKRSAVATALNAGRRRRQPTPALGVLNDMETFFDSLRDNLETLASLSPEQRSTFFQGPPTVVQAPASNATASRRQSKYPIRSARPHDYLYDSAYIISGAKDYARTSFKAAMMSAQVVIQPVYRTMFTDLRKFPRMHVAYYPNCRLPEHVDTSYNAYLAKVANAQNTPIPDLAGKHRFQFSAFPKKVLDLKACSPEFHPPSPVPLINGKPKNRGTQSKYRESSAQTVPWQPPGKVADSCENTPEVLYLDELSWGPGKPYRLGDLPCDFHTTEIINKMRHARIWAEIAERGPYPRWMKSKDQIIGDIVTKDWIFRQAEIDELQEIRLSLMQKLQTEQRQKEDNRTRKKLDKLWKTKKAEMEHKIKNIRRNRDRELRKLSAIHNEGGRQGICQRYRAMRGMGSPVTSAVDPTSDIYALMARHGYQARTRHAEISYDPSLLLLEDHQALAALPPWLEEYGQNLTKTCSGHNIPRDQTQLCERETKWSEKFLGKLHNDLKKARLGAAGGAGPLRILKPRRLQDTPRPATPEVEAVTESDEIDHQSALFIQKLIRGRAVQYLMYEGRTRAAELTEELKTTHGLQKEDKIRIAKEEAKARDYNSIRTEAEKKEDAITALVDELCGGAVSAALDFLEKELRRLQEERRQHAFIMIALREKEMREAAEAGRRQKEEHRRREHDEMFKQILGVTQDTVDSYLQDIIKEGIALSAEEEAVRRAQKQSDQLEEALKEQENMSTAEQNELIAELVQQFLLPSAHKAAAQHRIQELQRAKLEAAKKVIFGLLDDAEIRKPICTICGTPLDKQCHCTVCPTDQQPRESVSRDDPRWKHTKSRPRPKPKPRSQRYPPTHDFRCMLDCLIDEVVARSREQQMERDLLRREYDEMHKKKVEIELEAKDAVEEAFNLATGAKYLPVRKFSYHHFSRYIRGEAIERTEIAPPPCPCPEELPSKIRDKAAAKTVAEDGTCRCKEPLVSKVKLVIGPDLRDPKQRMLLLPSEVRALEDKKKCKCDIFPSPEDSQAGFQIDLTPTESTMSEFDINETEVKFQQGEEK
ncbi:hypothetical protein O0L34_g13884 [Tuta absoluta]|nr:hypothetical protein O0L34_g13884 [Tuta absoluta]